MAVNLWKQDMGFVFVPVGRVSSLFYYLEVRNICLLTINDISFMRNKCLSGSVGEGKLLFRSSECPWSREMCDGKEVPNKVTDGPYLFRTANGRLGMIWTSWIHNVYTQGVAYSQSGTLDGPWIQESEPITPPRFRTRHVVSDF